RGAQRLRHLVERHVGAGAQRAAGLLGKNGSSLKLFDKLTAEFKFTQHPDRIRWTGADAA
ncbi:hypothetical protein FGX01_00490, partial [Xylella fastidiosa subsp. multiplex]|nr:hypothetical protein [Xylella fastidiosa subsp. multiplex]